MSVFKKIKDVLFDIEEDEEIVVETHKRVVDENPIKEVKMPKEDREVSQEIVSEVPKKESSFNFPLDFDDEIPVKRETPKVDSYDKKGLFDDDFDVPRRNRNDYIVKEVERKHEEVRDYSKFLQQKKDDKKIFTPSPVISPVYGVLNQNYTKDDVIVKSDSESKNPTLEEVRKKAYTNKKAAEPVVEVDEFEEPLKTLDEILINSKVEESKSLENDLFDGFEEDIDVTNKIPEIDDNKNEDTNDEEDLLEKDLFNLIDSMYEDKEED